MKDYYKLLVFASDMSKFRNMSYQFSVKIKLMEKLFLTSKDNVKVSINRHKSGFNSVLIIAPGWFMGKDTKPFSSMAKQFAKHFDVISMDFRGHGKSGGVFTFSAFEYRDLEAVIEFSKSEYETVYLIGFSLGAATSVICAAKDNSVKKLILVSPPSEFLKIENHFFKPEAFVQTIKKFDLKNSFSVRAGNLFLPKTKPLEVIEKVQAPKLFIYGELDPTVYPWHTKKLFEKAIEPKSIIGFEQGIHAEDIYLQNPKKFLKTCTSWLNS